MSKKTHKKDGQDDTGKDSLFELQAYHYRAIELRYQGMSFKDIMGTLGVEFRKGTHHETIRRWFARDGLLANEYLAYARAENDQRRSMMREELKKLVAKVPIVMDGVLDRKDENGPDAIALSGVKLLVDILGITKEDAPGGGTVLDEYFERLEKMQVPKKEDAPAA